MIEFGQVPLMRERRLREERSIPIDVVGWIGFAEDLGFRIIWGRLPFEIHAVSVGNVILVHQGLNAHDELDAIRHEIAHRLLHAGNMLWWETLPMGENIIAKFERQANELAALMSR